MYSTADRMALLDHLIAEARTDDTVTAAALVGSFARGDADAWSDIDLALRVSAGTDPAMAADLWTERVARLHSVVDTIDIRSGSALYRVHLLDSTLQVDLSFWPGEDFGSADEAFTVLFGEADDVVPTMPTSREHLIGWGWLYALHARSALARGRVWQAMEMLSDVRKQVVALACVRGGVEPFHGRGIDRLPEGELDDLARTVPSSVEQGELRRAFEALVRLLGAEAVRVDHRRGARLRAVLDDLVASSDSAEPPEEGMTGIEPA